jgi:EAL domain-containing protein (putative c-di-GMP-specific phosphodiesterase class I)
MSLDARAQAARRATLPLRLALYAGFAVLLLQAWLIRGPQPLLLALALLGVTAVELALRALERELRQQIDSASEPVGDRERQIPWPAALPPAAVQTDLQRALQRSELRVVYQPQLDLAQRGLVAVQAQLRWQHPERGCLLAVEFMSDAEAAGQAEPMAQWLLEQACMQFVHWRMALGVHAPALLTVGLPPAQLRRPGLAQDLHQLMLRCGMQPEWLQLEIPAELAAAAEPAQAPLRLLKGMGCKLALDGFGGGQATLASLYQLPLDMVKIDRGFVQQAATLEHHRVLIEATVRVAHSLGLRCLAEGINTEAQAALMQELHCDWGQGECFSGPLPADAVAAWVLRDELASA